MVWVYVCTAKEESFEQIPIITIALNEANVSDFTYPAHVAINFSDLNTQVTQHPQATEDDEDTCLICLQSFNDGLSCEIRSIASDKNETRLPNVPISNSSLYTGPASVKMTQNSNSIHKCSNSRCSATFHKQCWQETMYHQMQRNHISIQTTIDLQCPHCKHLNNTLSESLKRYIAQNMAALRHTHFNQAQWRVYTQQHTDWKCIFLVALTIICISATIAIVIVLMT